MQQLSVENDTERDEDNSSTISLLQEADVNQPKVNDSQKDEAISSTVSLLQEADVNQPKDTRPRIKPTFRNTQYSVVEKHTSLKEKQKKVTEENTKTAVSETMLNPPFERELKHDSAYVKTEEEKSNFIEALDGSKLAKDPKQSLTLKETKPETGGEKSENDELVKEHKEVDEKNDDDSHQNLMRRTNQETETVSDRMMDGYSIAQKLTEHEAEKPEYRRNSVTEESEMQKPSGNSQEIDIEGTSVSDVKSVTCLKNEQLASKSYGGWLFPDERRRLCVTTGDNQMLDPVGGRTSNTFIRKDEMKISMEEKREAAETEANESMHNHQKMIKPESSENVNSFEGPLANAVKIAIMIGFGTLVLFTRQKQKKK